ncbi:MAG: hypothetical protein ACRD7E_21820 [Bryobacteraceae bacterium]
MSAAKGRCPLTTRQIVDEYFIENRTKLLDIAAFLDRLDRSADAEDPGRDYRVRAFRNALHTMADGERSRLMRVQMLFSDPTTEPREALDQKSANGAYNDAEAAW